MVLDFSDENYRTHMSEHRILIVDDSDMKLGEMRGISVANGFSMISLKQRQKLGLN